MAHFEKLPYALRSYSSGLLEQLLLATLAIGLHGRQGNGLVVTEVHTSALRVKETTGSVGGDGELATPGEARLEGAALALGHELLDGEKEGHVLAVRQLHGGGCEVHAVLLLEGDGVGIQAALNEGQGVGLASGQLGGGELLALVGLELHGEGLRLEAHVGQTGVALHWDLCAVGLHGGAAVGQAGALDLGIGQLAELLSRDGLGRLHGSQAEDHAQSGAEAQQRGGPRVAGHAWLRHLLICHGGRGTGQLRSMGQAGQEAAANTHHRQHGGQRHGKGVARHLGQWSVPGANGKVLGAKKQSIHDSPAYSLPRSIGI